MKRNDRKALEDQIRHMDDAPYNPSPEHIEEIKQRAFQQYMARQFQQTEVPEGQTTKRKGILRRVVVIDLGDEIVELVNPEVLETAGEQDGMEGCLSVPGYYGMVKRPMKVRVRAQDRYGKEFEVEDVEQTARCFCHELEHLDGHLFTERAEKLYTVEELDEMMNRESEEAKV